MKKLLLIGITLLISACSSTPEIQNDDKLCKTYSNAYLAVAIMKERGFSRKKSLACSLSALQDNTNKICDRKLPEHKYSEVIKFNKVENNEMTQWMGMIVYTVYASPTMKSYKWRDQQFKKCKSLGAFESAF
jgi:hypothetical protein